MRAFIFSLDAFVAFTLALIAVYSLIFFSSVPSGYYATLSQAHSLATDSLEALTLASCDSNPQFATLTQCNNDTVNTLEYLVYRGTIVNGQNGDVRDVLDAHIPEAYGYSFQIQEDGNWQSIYDSNKTQIGNRPKEARKLSVSAYALAFQYDEFVPELRNHYNYRTCKGELTVCGTPVNDYEIGSASIKLVRLVIYT